MSKKNLWLNMTCYSLAHGLVDAACVAALFAIVTPRLADLAYANQLILIYDVIAFAPQPLFACWSMPSKRRPGKPPPGCCWWQPGCC